MATAFALLLCGCASTAPGGRAQITVPTAISSLYSSIDMNIQLATTAPVAAACAGVQCQIDKAFERQVGRLGQRLALAAYAADPSLKERVPAFNFIVAETSEAGSASDAQGTVVIYRGVRKNRLEEEVLAYLIAVEMGHVIARHHDEKSATSIMFSVATMVFFPLANLTGGVATLAGSVASAAGTRMIAADKDKEHTDEAEAIALDLLARQGWSRKVVVASLRRYSAKQDGSDWAYAMKTAAIRVEQNASGVVLLVLNQHDASRRMP